MTAKAIEANLQHLVRAGAMRVTNPKRKIGPTKYALTKLGIRHVEDHLPDNRQADCALCKTSP